MATKPITTTLYGGTHEVIFNPNARGRAPRYKVDGQAVMGVTTILGNVLAKKGLMTWPMDVALDYLKTRLPLLTEDDLRTSAGEHIRLRDAGGSSGTAAHSLIEDYLTKTDGGGTTDEGAINAFMAFKQWYEETKPTVLGIENVIYSSLLRYAGTYDALLEIDGQVILADWKTTNPSREAPKGIYAENFIQLGGYAGAHEEQRKFELAEGGTELREIEDLMIVSAKKNGVLDIVKASELDLTVDDCIVMFEQTIGIHDLLRRIKAGLGGK